MTGMRAKTARDAFGTSGSTAPGRRPSGRRAAVLCVGCLSASGMLTPGPVLAQEALLNSLPQPAAAPTEPIDLESSTYTIKSGDFRALVTPSMGVQWNDNINLSRDGGEEDFILAPVVGIHSSYPISQRNLLQLDVSFGYDKYVRHDDLSSWYVQSGSALSFDIAVKEFLINLHDRFSYVQDSAQESAVANTGSYGTLNNTAGAQVTWNLNAPTLSLGYDHQIIQATDSHFDSINETSELIFGRAGLRLSPDFTAGAEGTVTVARYEQTILNDNTIYTAGIYANWQLGNYFDLQARGGYTLSDYGQTSETIRTSNLNSWYIEVTAHHQISDSMEYTFRAGHDLQAGIESDTIEMWHADSSFAWNIIRGWPFQTEVSYVHGNQGQGNQTGNLTETYDWVAFSIGLSHPVTKKFAAALNYRLTLRGSDIPSNEYTQNEVQLQMTYTL